MRVRPPAVAGSFYPADPDALREAVERALASVPPAADAPHAPKALVVPHAGYVYSGDVAASGYARVASARGAVERVVLLGPAHRAAVEGIAASSAEAFASPLDLVPVDEELRARVLELPSVRIDDGAHALEHSLEVHLPFLQVVLGEFALLPLVVGRPRADDVAEVLDLVWGGPDTLIVVSTDLSHYHDYAEAAVLDRATAAAIVARRTGELGPLDACGVFPLCGLLVAAERHGLPVTLLDLRNSGDTAGPRDRVVGYGAFAVG